MHPIAPHDVHETLKKHLLVEGFDMVLDLEKSKGSWLIDAKSGKKFLDMFSFFASLPLGMNHPRLTEKSFLQKLARAAVNKVANSDIYTVEFAEAADAFDRYALPSYLPHLFFVDGGTLGVENALKAAFDWKVQKNFAKGYKEEKGHQVIHFRHAFHGRSGYTLSLTNTADPRKYQYFPQFPWPRIDPPFLTFPQNEKNRDAALKAEKVAYDQIAEAIHSNPDDIAALLIEPIQAEGGDHHFRPEFFQGLRNICDDHEIMLIFDEVQTGMGITGKMWAHEHWNVRPDMLAFGKKTQVCGMMCGTRIDEIERNVFVEPSRMNSTFGGNIVDYVRIARILEVMHEEKILDHVAKVGAHLLQQLHALEKEFEEVTNTRGLGLMCAFDLPTTEARNRVRTSCYERGMVILPCGTHSIRFRPSLTVTKEEIDIAIDMLKKSLENV